MANGSEEARKFALAMTLSASATALLALAIWTGLLDVGFDDTERRLLTALLAVVCISEAVLGRVLYLRKFAAK